jgi:hypothetical protein
MSVNGERFIVIPEQQSNLDLNKLETDFEIFLYNPDNACPMKEQNTYRSIFLLLAEQLLY